MKKISAITVILMISASLMFTACGGDDGSGTDGDVDTQENASESDGQEDGDADSSEAESSEETEIVEADEEAETEPEIEEFVACDNPDGCYELPYAINRLRGSQDQGANNILPFPYNYFSVADTKAPTGIKLQLTPAVSDRKYEFNANIIDSGLKIMGHEQYVRSMNTLDGFSVSAHLMFESGVQVDQSILDNDANTALSLINITESSEKFGQPVTFHAQSLEAAKTKDGLSTHLFWYVQIQPDMPLDAKSRYAVVITKDMLSVDGQPPQMSPHFQQVWGVAPPDESAKAAAEIGSERERMIEVKEILAGFDFIDMDKIVMAYDFTTQSVNDDVLYIVDQYKNLTPSAPDMDYDEDGTVNFYRPDEWPAELGDHPSWDENVEFVALGTLEIPEWRHCTNKDTQEECYYEFKRDEDHHPMQNGTNVLRFFLFYPKNAVQPMPLVDRKSTL